MRCLYLLFALGLSLVFVSSRSLAQPTADGAREEAETTRAVQQLLAALAPQRERLLTTRSAATDRPLAINLVPFDATATDIPANIAARLTGELATAFAKQGAGAVDVLDNRNLAAVYDQLAFTSSASFDRLAKNTEADALLVAEIDRSLADTILVRYRLVGLRGELTNHLLAAADQRIGLRRALLDAPRPQRVALHDAANALARLMAERLREAPGIRPTLDPEPASSDFDEALLRQFIPMLGDELEWARRGAVAFTDDRRAPPAPLSLRLALQVAETSSAIEATITLADADARTRLVRLIRIDPASVDPALIAALRAVGTVRAAGADISRTSLMERPIAHLAALATARLRLIAVAGGEDPQAIRPATNLAEAMAALGGLGHTVTYDEVWTEADLNGTSMLRLALRGRVARLRSDFRMPIVELPRRIRSGENVVIGLRAAAPINVALFEWASDDTLTRLYPADPNAGQQRARSLALSAGGTVVLGAAGQATLRLQPATGVARDIEALLIVATDRDFDLADLAGGISTISADQVSGGLVSAADRDAALTISRSHSRPANEVFGRLARWRNDIAIMVIPFELDP